MFPAGTKVSCWDLPSLMCVEFRKGTGSTQSAHFSDGPEYPPRTLEASPLPWPPWASTERDPSTFFCFQRRYSPKPPPTSRVFLVNSTSESGPRGPAGRDRGLLPQLHPGPLCVATVRAPTGLSRVLPSPTSRGANPTPVPACACGRSALGAPAPAPPRSPGGATRQGRSPPATCRPSVPNPRRAEGLCLRPPGPAHAGQA